MRDKSHPYVQEQLDRALDYLESVLDQSGPSGASSLSLPPNFNVPRILYEHPLDYVPEYPETSATGAVEHLSRMDLENWQDPTLNIAYSRGGRMGQSLSETSVNIGMVENANSHTSAQKLAYKTLGEIRIFCKDGTNLYMSPGFSVPIDLIRETLQTKEVHQLMRCFDNRVLLAIGVYS
ncbi:hypothetical protein B0H14DRAFT_2571198 [Mycena olivaceomarginata]|nr:hypothetical protein B0H14DRAFT_2571198 [Mycena olivaceomarginata]